MPGGPVYGRSALLDKFLYADAARLLFANRTMKARLKPGLRILC